MPSFIIVGYVWRILRRGLFWCNNRLAVLWFFLNKFFNTWEGGVIIGSTIHAFFALTEVKLDIAEILKSINLEVKVSLFAKILQNSICCVFPSKLTFSGKSDVTNVD